MHRFSLVLQHSLLGKTASKRRQLLNVCFNLYIHSTAAFLMLVCGVVSLYVPCLGLLSVVLSFIMFITCAHTYTGISRVSAGIIQIYFYGPMGTSCKIFVTFVVRH